MRLGRRNISQSCAIIRKVVRVRGFKYRVCANNLLLNELILLGLLRVVLFLQCCCCWLSLPTLRRLFYCVGIALTDWCSVIGLLSLFISQLCIKSGVCSESHVMPSFIMSLSRSRYTCCFTQCRCFSAGWYVLYHSKRPVSLSVVALSQIFFLQRWRKHDMQYIIWELL